MFKSFYKLIFISAITLIASASLSAKVVEQKNVNFPIQADDLLRGEIHYYFGVFGPRDLAAQRAELYELDSLSLASEADVKIMVTKSVMVVNRPVGFFDDKQLMEESYVTFMAGGQKVKKLGPDSYRISAPGTEGQSYKMTSYFDADDVSTLPNSKVIRAVTAAKKLDVISQSASSIMFTEKTNFTKFTEGAVSVSSFVPMKENKTLIITYNLYGIQKKYMDEKLLKKNFLDEVEATKNLLEKFK